MMTNLNNQITSLDRAKKGYEKAFKEAEKALENYQRADADLNLSRAEVEKQRVNMTTKSQYCEETKKEYAIQLQKTNDIQVRGHISCCDKCYLSRSRPSSDFRIKIGPWGTNGNISAECPTVRANVLK